MILDTLDHHALYEPLHARFTAAFTYLRSLDGRAAEGRNDLDGDNLFARVQRVTTKPAADSPFEAHRQYIDIQCVLRGRETILWAPLGAMRKETLPYDPAKDVAKWNPVTDATPLHLVPGHFAILFPGDAHAPCVEWGAPEEVLKVVVKVRV